jgi:hypothetical protein
MAPRPTETLCNLTGDWECFDGINSDGKCLQKNISVKQTGDQITYGAATGSVSTNGYVTGTVTPNGQPGVVTSVDGKDSGCDRIRWYGDEEAHWCRKGKVCSVPSSFKDPIEINFCADGTIPPEGIRINPCSPNNPLKGQNFTVPAQQFNILHFENQKKDSVWLYYGERSMSAPDGLKSHNFQAWMPLSFDDAGRILPLKFLPSFQIDVD